MCAQITQRFTTKEIAEDLGQLAFQDKSLSPSKERVFPTHNAIGIRSMNGLLFVDEFFWSLLPKGTTNTDAFTKKYSTFNAKSETLTTSKMYSTPWSLGQRLVIPVNNFVEWRGEKGQKERLYLSMKDQPYTFIAGLYAHTGPAETGYQTCTMLTSAPNSFMKPIHHRMPVILKDWRAWLSPDLSPDEALKMTEPYELDLDLAT